MGDVDLDEPVLVMGMEGWIDAGLGGGAAMATLVEQVPNQVIARFDTDLLLDQRARRPVLRIVDGVTSPLKWPDIELRAGEDRAGKSVLLLVGPEPDMQWKSFTNAVVGLGIEMGVRLAVGLGAFPAPVPHTRPTRLASTATNAELAVQVGFVPGTIDVPAGIHAALERGFADQGVPAVGLWARVPHYAAAMPYPSASAALIDGLASVAGLTLHSGDLQTAAAVTSQRIDELIANSEEHTAMVQQLEAQVDAAEEPGGFDVGNLPSGEEIAAELERFLRGER
ncbi:MAG: PAC2 family protein [Actinobacteria bacterium]|nr:PAC2 family protein [Actinomycetota bacterium]